MKEKLSTSQTGIQHTTIQLNSGPWIATTVNLICDQLLTSCTLQRPEMWKKYTETYHTVELILQCVHSSFADPTCAGSTSTQSFISLSSQRETEWERLGTTHARNTPIAKLGTLRDWWTWRRCVLSIVTLDFFNVKNYSKTAVSFRAMMIRILSYLYRVKLEPKQSVTPKCLSKEITLVEPPVVSKLNSHLNWKARLVKVLTWYTPGKSIGRLDSEINCNFVFYIMLQTLLNV